MKCTSCKEGTLTPSTLDETLICHTCDNCGGHWIKLSNYYDWHKTQEVKPAVVEEIGVEVDTVDSKRALFCPETGAVMSKFKISSDTSHNIDWCNASASIWLDKGEWELLKEKGVADKLNQIFSEEWQKQILEETARNNREAQFIDKLGEENYSRLKLVRSWLHEQTDEQKVMMISFLVSRDPFAKK